MHLWIAANPGIIFVHVSKVNIVAIFTLRMLQNSLVDCMVLGTHFTHCYWIKLKRKMLVLYIEKENVNVIQKQCYSGSEPLPKK